MKTVFNKWDMAHEDAKSNIQHMLSKTSDDEKDFIRLAKWCLTTEINPYSFMPTGWESSLGDSVKAESFLACLHHAMLDDGDLCFASTSYGEPCMEFCEPDDLIKIVNSSGRKALVSHQWTVEQFIAEVEKYPKEYNKKVEAFMIKRQQLCEGSADGVFIISPGL